MPLTECVAMREEDARATTSIVNSNSYDLVNVNIDRNFEITTQKTETQLCNFSVAGLSALIGIREGVVGHPPASPAWLVPAAVRQQDKQFLSCEPESFDIRRNGSKGSSQFIFAGSNEKMDCAAAIV